MHLEFETLFDIIKKLGIIFYNALDTQKCLNKMHKYTKYPPDKKKSRNILFWIYFEEI